MDSLAIRKAYNALLDQTEIRKDDIAQKDQKIRHMEDVLQFKEEQIKQKDDLIKVKDTIIKELHSVQEEWKKWEQDVMKRDVVGHERWGPTARVTCSFTIYKS